MSSLLADLSTTYICDRRERLKDELARVSRKGQKEAASATHLGAICKFVGGQVDLAEGSFANQSSEGIVSHRSKVFARELATQQKR